MNENIVPALPPKLKQSSSFRSKNSDDKERAGLGSAESLQSKDDNAIDSSSLSLSEEDNNNYSIPTSQRTSISSLTDSDLISAIPHPPVPPAFMNPLYFAFNDKTSKVSSESILKSTTSDTDSIYFLEKNNLYPSLDSICRKRECFPNEPKEGNIYDICSDEIADSVSPSDDNTLGKATLGRNLNEPFQDPPDPPSRISSRIKETPGVDIFDLVTFESPLSETVSYHGSSADVRNSNIVATDVVPRPSLNVSSSNAYDVPVQELSPPSFPPPPPPVLLTSDSKDLNVNTLNLPPCPSRPAPPPPPLSPLIDTPPVILRKAHPNVCSKVSESDATTQTTPTTLSKSVMTSPILSRKPLDVSQMRRPLPAIPVARQPTKPNPIAAALPNKDVLPVKPHNILIPTRSAPEPPYGNRGATSESQVPGFLPPPVPPKLSKSPLSLGESPVKDEVFEYAIVGKPCKVSEPPSVPPPLPKRTYNTQKTPCTTSGCLGKNCDHKPVKETSKFYASQDTPFVSHSSSADNITVRHAGYLYKTGSNRKDFERRWCELLNGRLDYFLDDTARILRGSIAMKDITGVSVVPNDQVKQYSTGNLELLCFDVSTVQERGRRFLFGAKLPSERQLWMNLLAQAVAPTAVHSLLNGVSFSHAGFLHMKEGASGQWHIAFLVLHERKLTICSIDDAVPETLDLRRAVAVEHVTSSSQSCAAAYEQGHPLYVNMPQKFLYLQGEYQQHTEVWLQALHQAWTVPPNAHLEDQHLTQENVPVVVDKCLNFIGTHGVTEQGIYRLAGTSSKIKKLLEAFQSNPWSVHLKCEDYSVHDVASALKRYIRNFPECVLTEKLCASWRNACSITDREERLRVIKELLRQLPEVNYFTLKKLIAHLSTICENSGKNMMPILNLAPIFGPTLLFQVNSPDDANYCQTNCGMDIMSDLITSYSWLFEVDPKELEKEKKIQEALKLIREAKIAKRPTGDILMGVYIYDKNWGKCLNVKLSPTTTAEELCRFAIARANLKETVDKLAVYEIVCNEELERPLHYSEKPLAVTLRWAEWSDKEAKGNHLCIKYNNVYYSVMPYLMARQPFSMFSELRYAEGRSKTFKKVFFEFVGAKLTCHKDAKVAKPLGEWNIEDITWYAGAESKRSPPTKWAFTFIERHLSFKRSKDNPYFGRTVCCNTEEEFHKWIAAMLLGEFPQGVLPPQKRAPDLLTS